MVIVLPQPKFLLYTFVMVVVLLKKQETAIYNSKHIKILLKLP